MNETKAWYQSKTIIASLVTILAALVGLFGYTVDLDTQNQIVEVVVTVVAGISGVITIYGRIRATKQIK